MATGAAFTAALSLSTPWDDGAGPPVTIPRGTARDAARRELSKGMYHDGDPSLFQRAVTRVWNWFGDLLDAAAGITPGGGLGLTVIVLLAVGIAAALWWRLGSPRRNPTSSAPLFDAGPRTAAEHRATAAAHAAQGHWNRAVQERMRAVVRSLEERALIEPRPGRTADEAAAEAAASLPGHTDRLHTAARQFDDVAYGGRSADEAAYERLAALDEDLERTRPQLAAATHTSDSTHQPARDTTA